VASGLQVDELDGLRAASGVIDGETGPRFMGGTFTEAMSMARLYSLQVPNPVRAEAPQLVPSHVEERPGRRNTPRRAPRVVPKPARESAMSSRSAHCSWNVPPAHGEDGQNDTWRCIRRGRRRWPRSVSPVAGPTIRHDRHGATCAGRHPVGLSSRCPPAPSRDARDPAEPARDADPQAWRAT